MNLRSKLTSNLKSNLRSLLKSLQQSKRNKKSRRAMFLAVAALAITGVYNACARSGFKTIAEISEGTFVDMSVNGKSSESTSVVLFNYDQILRSSLSLTGVTIDNSIQNEFNNRSSLLSETFDVSELTSPMWIGMSNINGQICSALVTREAATTQRRFFVGIDFTRAASQVSDQNFRSVANNFSSIFWNRTISSTEDSALITAKSEFISAILPVDVNNAQQTRNLMLFVCTAMLSSMETFTLQ